jgi:hypothetical protein
MDVKSAHRVLRQILKFFPTPMQRPVHFLGLPEKNDDPYEKRFDRRFRGNGNLFQWNCWIASLGWV